MTASVRGWCPSLYRPMASGDGLIIRIKPRAGRLSAADTVRVADLAGRYGNGRIQLTIRGNWQIRGVPQRNVLALGHAAAAAGLAHADPAVEAVRNLLCHPLGAGRLGPALEDALAAAPDLTALPDKFGFVVDDGASALGPVPGDIRVIDRGDGASVMLDGSPLTARVDDPVAAVLALARLFLDRRGDARRMRTLVADRGAAALFEAAGLVPGGTGTAGPRLAAIGQIADGALGLGLPFGQIAAPRLALLANLAAALGDGWLRLGPGRALVVSGLSPIAAGGLVAALGEDVIAEPADPRRQVVACTGAPLCPNARIDSRAVAAAIAAQGRGPLVHVSGCPKGCAHPAVAPLTLVGFDDGLALIRDGRAGDPPAATGLDRVQAVALVRP